jgi:hypothetical protein
MSRPLFEHHPVLGYRFVPGVKARVPHEGGGYLVRANAAGFRSEHEFTPARPPGAYRALLFGDSFTAGDGVSNRDRYGDLLERQVPGVQVLNFGLPGSGTDQQYLAWREMAAGIEHDLLVLAVQVENIRRVAARYRTFEAEGREVVLAKPYFTLGGDGALSLHGVPVPREPLRMEDVPPEDLAHLDRGGDHALMRKVVNKLGVKDVVQTLTRYQPLPAYDRADHPDWRLMRAILARWIAESSAPVLLMPVPVRGRDQLARRLPAALPRAGGRHGRAAARSAAGLPPPGQGGAPPAALRARHPSHGRVAPGDGRFAGAAAAVADGRPPRRLPCGLTFAASGIAELPALTS